MSQKDMRRSDWHRLLEKKYVSKDFSVEGIRGKASLLQIKKVSAPLIIDNIAGHVLIADSGISWLQLALEESSIWITVMYDQNDAFIQAYFDITDGNCFASPDNPTFEDMYLDVVLNKDLKIYLLDEEELEEALLSQRISKQQYEDATYHCGKLACYLQQNAADFLQYCAAVYFELKQRISLKRACEGKLFCLLYLRFQNGDASFQLFDLRFIICNQGICVFNFR